MGHVVVANVHLIAGCYKDDKEDHSIPGNTPQARELFKFQAISGAMRQVEALAYPQGKWFVLGDMNLLPEPVERLLDYAAAQVRVQGVSAVCNVKADAEKRRDWILSPVAVEPSTTADLVSADKAHTALIGSVSGGEEVIEQAPQAAKYQAMAEANVGQWRSANAEIQAREAGAGRAQEETDFDARVPTTPRPPKLQRISVQPGGDVLITMADDDGKESTVAAGPPLILEDGTWRTPPPSPRGSAGQAQQAPPLPTAAETARAGEPEKKSPPQPAEAPSASATPLSTASPADDALPARTAAIAEKAEVNWLAAVLLPPVPRPTRPSSPPPGDVHVKRARGPPPSAAALAPPAAAGPPTPPPTTLTTPDAPAAPPPSAAAPPPSAAPPPPAAVPTPSAESPEWSPALPRASLEKAGDQAASSSSAAAPAEASAPAAAAPRVVEVSLEDDVVVEDPDGLKRRPPSTGVKTVVGDVFVRIVSSKVDQERVVAAVLQIRADVLRDSWLEEDVKCVPWCLQKVITERLKKLWWEQKTAKEQRALDYCRSKDAMKRTKESHFRATISQHFGGMEWYYCVAALGQVPIEMIVSLGSRAPAEPKPAEPKTQPRVVTGVQHTVSDPKLLRERAKLKEKWLNQMREDWRRGKPIRGYYALRSEVEDLWEEAIAASNAAGHPYIGRDGKLVNPKPPGKFEASLRQYCAQVLQIPFPE